MTNEVVVRVSAHVMTANTGEHQMTKEQANDWVNAHCRFAFVDDARAIVRKASPIELTDEEADFFVVKAAVCAALKEAAIDLEQQLSQAGINLDFLIKEAASEFATPEGAQEAPNPWTVVNRVMEMIKDKAATAAQRGMVQVSPQSLAGFATQNLVKQKVVQYLKTADPAEFFVRQKKKPVGPYAGDQPRARGVIPQRTDAPALTVEKGPWKGYHPRTV